VSRNVDSLRAVYARWERGDLAASVALLDERVTLVVDPDIPDGGSYQGTEGVRGYMARFLEPWDSLAMAGESYREAGDSVLVKVRQTGTGKASGVPVELEYFHLWTFEEERVTRLEVIMDTERALSAIDRAE
jgi:ketosteroid isomerase-like protein